jgi:hypothetical protein
MIHCAGVAWLRRGIVRRECTRAKVEQATQRVGPFRKNLQMLHEGKCGTKDLGGKQPPYMRKKRATVISIRGWSSKQLSPLGRRVLAYEALKKTLELEFVKRACGMSSGFRKIWKWTLWKGRPPPKRKRKKKGTADTRGAGNVGALATP